VATSASAWKGLERRLARRFGAERHGEPHGPDFVYRGVLNSEVKLRENPPIKQLESWLKNAELLFVVRKHSKTDDGLVVMRVSTFEQYFDWNKAEPATEEEEDDVIDTPIW
jgi:hypothetical protein